MQSLNSLTLLILLGVTACCSAYIEVRASNRQGVNQTNVIYFTDAVMSFMKDQGRQVGWFINWLASTGVLGQMMANVLVAIFILPPLGPYICGFFDNCDNLQLRARHFLRTLDMNLSPLDRQARHVEEMDEEMTKIMAWLDDAYDKYST